MNQTQKIDISIIPGGVPSIARIKQYDTGRTIQATIFDDANAMDLSDTAYVMVGLRRGDGTQVVVNDSISFSLPTATVTIPITIAMSEIAGRGKAEIAFYSENRICLASADFAVDVERSAASGAPAAQEIDRRYGESPGISNIHRVSGVEVPAEILERVIGKDGSDWEAATLDIHNSDDTSRRVYEFTQRNMVTKEEICAAMNKARTKQAVAGSNFPVNATVNLYPYYPVNSTIGVMDHADLNSDGSLLFAGKKFTDEENRQCMEYATYSIDHEGNVQATGITHSFAYSGSLRDFTSAKYMGAYSSYKANGNLMFDYLVINKNENTSITGTIEIDKAINNFDNITTYNVAVPTYDHLAIIADERGSLTVAAVLDLTDESISIYSRVPLNMYNQTYRGMNLVGDGGNTIIYTTAKKTDGYNLAQGMSVKEITLANQEKTEILNLTGDDWYFEKIIWLKEDKFGLLNVTKWQIEVYNTLGQLRNTIKFKPILDHISSVESVVYNKENDTLSVLINSQVGVTGVKFAVFDLKLRTISTYQTTLPAGSGNPYRRWFFTAGGATVQNATMDINIPKYYLGTYSGLYAIDTNIYYATPGYTYQGLTQEAVTKGEIVSVKVTKKQN